jgi:hypothetical protein
MHPYKYILRVIHSAGGNGKRLHRYAKTVYINVGDYHTGKVNDFDVGMSDFGFSISDFGN